MAATAADPSGRLTRAITWPGVEGVDLLGPDGAPGIDLPEAGPEALEALRVEAGVPAMGAEVHEGTIPAELGQWVIDASVSFTKGCYTGQELVARIDSRGGNVPRPVRGLLLDGAASVGAAVLVDGERGRPDHLGRPPRPDLGVVALAPMARSRRGGGGAGRRRGAYPDAWRSCRSDEAAPGRCRRCRPRARGRRLHGRRRTRGQVRSPPESSARRSIDYSGAALARVPGTTTTIGLPETGTRPHRRAPWPGPVG